MILFVLFFHEQQILISSFRVGVRVALGEVYFHVDEHAEKYACFCCELSHFNDIRSGKHCL